MGATKTILFVYGTLKRGERNHHLIADQEFIGEVVTTARYRVFDLGPYPGLVHDETNDLAVVGELFAVSERCLVELDRFEGVPELFVRALIEVEGHEEVWAYFWNRPAPEGAKSGERWPRPGERPA